MTTVQNTSLLGERLAAMLHDYSGQEIFAADALFDINVPTWRFHVHGVAGFVRWLQSYAPRGYAITVVRELPTVTGFVLEIEGEYTSDGAQLFFRTLYVCDVADERITRMSFWCTGDWDPETRARYDAMTAAARPRARRSHPERGPVMVRALIGIPLARALLAAGPTVAPALPPSRRTTPAWVRTALRPRAHSRTPAAASVGSWQASPRGRRARSGTRSRRTWPV